DCCGLLAERVRRAAACSPPCGGGLGRGTANLRACGHPLPVPPLKGRERYGAVSPESRHGACCKPTMLYFIEQCLNGVQLGMLLFLLAAGLTLIFGIMDLVNLAHGSLY